MPPYTLHNLSPEQVLSPASAAELADALREASAAGRAIVPWGGGTRQHIGRAPQAYDTALSTARLSGVVAYEPADLVVSVAAGTPLGALQAELARHGQWLPWDPACPAEASVGGLLASGAAGPLRLGYGPPRDWLLGMQVALGDGRLVRSGGRVVKNVAGYDSHKLHLGALGTLGVIVEASFKVQPLPALRQTLLAAFAEPAAAHRALERLREPPLQPIALVALSGVAAGRLPALGSLLAGQPGSVALAACYAGAAGAVERQAREATGRCVEAGARTIELLDAGPSAIWGQIAELPAPARDGSLLLRAGAPPAALAELDRLLERAAAARGWPAERHLLAGVGLGYSRWPAGAAAEEFAAALAELRAGLAAIGGYAVVEQAPPAIAAGLDVWGPAPEGLALMRALRARWDPAGILNPGRYIV